VSNGKFTGRGARGWVAFWALWAAALGGCGGDPAATGPAGAGRAGSAPSTGGAGPRLRFITNTNSDWWNAVEKGMTDGGAKFGARVEMRRNEGTSEGQIRQLEEVLSDPEVKGVAVSVLEADSPGIADKMRDLQKAGKVVIAVDSDGATDARRAYIGTNNKRAGEAAGKAAATLRPGGGKAAVFVGSDAAANAALRRQGFFEAAGPKFVRTEVFEDSGDKGRAQVNVQTAITKYPDLGLMLGVYSYNGPRIAEEVNKSPDLRKRTTLVTFDLDEQAIAMLEKGWIDASVCQNPYEIGYQGVRLLKALVENDAATTAEMLKDGSDSLDTGVRVIVPSADSPVKGENVLDIKGMKDWLAGKGLKSS